MSFIAVFRYIEIEKTIKRIGTANVKLNILNFFHLIKLDLINVEWLKRLFGNIDGCVSNNLLNHILTIISES